MFFPSFYLPCDFPLGKNGAARPAVAVRLQAVAGQTAAQAQAQTSAQGPSPDDDLINPDRPGIADGSTVIGKHHFQVEAGITYEKRNIGGVNSWDLQVPTLLRLGLDSRWELRMEGNGLFYYHQSSGGQTYNTSGYNPISIGAKYHFQDDGGPKKPSLGVIARVFSASGSSIASSNIFTGDLRLTADWDIVPPKWSLNPNLGVGSYQDGATGNRYTCLLGAMTLNYFPNPKLNYFVDGGYQGPEAQGGKNSLQFDAGIAWVVGRNTQWDLSVGTGASGDTPARPFVAFGYSFRI